MTRPNLDDLAFNSPARDGDYDAMLVKVFVNAAEVATKVAHGLQRIPRRVSIVWSDNPIMSPQVDSMDAQKAILTFFESKTNIILRFE